MSLLLQVYTFLKWNMYPKHPKTNEKDWKRTPSADRGLNVSVDFVIIRPFHHRSLHHSLLPDRKVVTCVLFGFVGIHPTLIRCSQMSIFKQNIVASQGNKMVQTWATCSFVWKWDTPKSNWSSSFSPLSCNICEGHTVPTISNRPTSHGWLISPIHTKRHSNDS